MATMTPSGEQLIILLNETFIPPTIFSDTNLVFGTPSAAPEDATDYDTVVDVTGVPGRGYFGDAEIHYTRVPLSNLDGLVSLASLDDFTLASIASLMNAAYGTFLDASDFVPQDIASPTQGNSSTVTLVAADTSLGWKGQVDITITHDKPHLNVAISNQRLNVLTDGASYYLNGRDYLWNFDFTSLRDAIAPKYFPINQSFGYSGFTDFATLADVCTKLGIPAFPQPNWVNTNVADYATSQIADSNKNFDRVVIYAPILGGRFYQSSLYFHYNVLENR
jgi:hypothetical protein